MLRYRSTEDVTNKPIEILIPSNLNTFSLKSLESNKTYHISLAAQTKFGTGIASQIKVHTESNGNFYKNLKFIHLLIKLARTI